MTVYFHAQINMNQKNKENPAPKVIRGGGIMQQTG